jgi:hypothetical protein
MESFANGYESISGRARHVIVIKRHSVIESLIMLVPSFPPLLGDFLIRVTIFARGGICYAFLALCPKLLVLGLEIFKIPHEILQGWSLMAS